VDQGLGNGVGLRDRRSWIITGGDTRVRLGRLGLRGVDLAAGRAELSYWVIDTGPEWPPPGWWGDVAVVGLAVTIGVGPMGGLLVRHPSRLGPVLLALSLLVSAGCGQSAGGPTARGDRSGATAAERLSETTTVPIATTPTSALTSTPTPTTTEPHLVGLPTPTALPPFTTPALAGEGQWHAAGRSVDQRPALYITTLRPPYSNTVAGVAWMDTRLVRARLYSGSISPGHGPWTYTAPIQLDAALTLVCAFNGGFKPADSKGGYYTQGRIFAPLAAGAASLVITADGNITVGMWGRDVSMQPDVVSVRQNLTLLVDRGLPVPGLSPSDASAWGSTLKAIPQGWRSGLGTTANGALVYVAGPALNIVQLADLLVRAGAVRAMELDINRTWDTFTFYAPASGAPATPINGADLLPQMSGGTTRFFDPFWARDFLTMSAR